MNTTPVSLLQRLQRPDDSEAWNHFVALYRPLFFAWVKRLNVPASDADDLVQEVLVVLVGNLPQFQRRATGSFRSWLRIVTRNKWLELQRRRHAQPVGDGAALAMAEAPDHAEQFWETEFRERLLARALELMKSDFQESTWQAAWEVIVSEKTPAAVAMSLGMTIGAVRAARFRVVTRLRQDLAGMLDD